jgi:hypothetical protein
VLSETILMVTAWASTGSANGLAMPAAKAVSASRFAKVRQVMRRNRKAHLMQLSGHQMRCVGCPLGQRARPKPGSDGSRFATARQKMVVPHPERWRVELLRAGGASLDSLAEKFIGRELRDDAPAPRPQLVQTA